MDYLSWIKPLYNVDTLRGCGEPEIEAMKARFGALPQAVLEVVGEMGEPV